MLCAIASKRRLTAWPHALYKKEEQSSAIECGKWQDVDHGQIHRQ